MFCYLWEMLGTMSWRSSVFLLHSCPKVPLIWQLPKETLATRCWIQVRTPGRFMQLSFCSEANMANISMPKVTWELLRTERLECNRSFLKSRKCHTFGPFLGANSLVQWGPESHLLCCDLGFEYGVYIKHGSLSNIFENLDNLTLTVAAYNQSQRFEDSTSLQHPFRSPFKEPTVRPLLIYRFL